MISREYSICGFRVYIYIYTKLQHLQIQKCKKTLSFLCLEYSICGVRVYIYIYTKLYLALPPQHNILSVDFAYIYIYIRKTVMLNHVYQIHNCEILAFNILSVDPRFFNILTSSPLL